MAEVILGGLLLSLLTGGSLRQLAQEPLRGEVGLLVLLPVQLTWPQVAARLGLACGFSIIVWLLMMALLAVALLLNVGRRPALALAALGIAANVVVIGFNQAMPVDIRAASEIGVSREASREALEEDCLHEELDQETRLPVLADVVAVPGPVWQRGVISLGDILLAAGLGLWIFIASRPARNE